jgi:dipeptidyl aminopeptidase/acylaminoacyl peptidase
LAPTPTSPAATAPVPRYSIEQLMANLRLQGVSIAPDGRKAAFSSNASGIANVYEVPIEGGAPRALTTSTVDGQILVRYFPQDERILVSADQGGNELRHLFVRERDGSIKDLTPGAGHQSNFCGFARDEQSFFVCTNERDKRFFDVYEYSARDYQRSLLFENRGGYAIGAVSRDKRFIALEKSHTRANVDIVVYDRTTRLEKIVTPGETLETARVFEFTPDGQILAASDRDGEFATLIKLDPATGRRTTLLNTNWDVTNAEFSPDDRYLLVAINADAKTEVRILDAATLAPVTLPKVPAGDLTSVTFSRDAKQIAFMVASSRVPGSLWTASLGGNARELVSALNPSIDARHLVEGEIARFASYDGLEIPGVMYWPHGASATNKVPAVVWVHGGPGGQSRLNYSPFLQFLANRGYAVYAINNRGSAGYGKTFYAADDRKHGEADLDDVVASKKMLIASGRIDPERIAIAGGSYGGYMTLAALAFRPKEFRVGINIYGVANWVRTLESIPPWWESQRKALYEELGDPAKDRARLERISPLFHAKNIEQPLIVLQGANDPRVLQRESDEIVAAVKANGVPVEYVVFPDEGHGFTKRENEIRAYEAALQFLETHM